MKGLDNARIYFTQETLPWQPILEAKLADRFSFVELAFRN